MAHRLSSIKRTIGTGLLLCVLLLLLPLIFPSFTNASFPKAISNAKPTSPVWVTYGPEGGGTAPIRIAPSNPEVMYTVSYNRGVYRSDDSGTQWHFVGLHNVIIEDLVIDSGNPYVVYAFTFRDETAAPATYRSMDGGAHWTKLTMPVYTVTGIVANPLPAGMLYVVDTGVKEKGIYVSTDYGIHWTYAAESGFQEGLNALTVNPNNINEIYALSNEKLVKTTDGGYT